MLRMLVVLGSIVGCGVRSEPKTSSSSQLISQVNSFKCTAEPERLDAVARDYGSFVDSKETEAWRTKTLSYMALFPESYLNYIFTRNDVRVTRSSFGGMTTLGSATGLARPQGPERPGKPYKIEISMGQPHYNGMLHELGHAVSPHIDNLNESFFANLTSTFNTIVGQGSQESQKMWSYPKTNLQEFWAEIVDSFYCSAASREHFEKSFPETFSFAARYLQAR